MKILDYIKSIVNKRTKRGMVTFAYVLAITSAFIWSLTSNNYVNASVSPAESLNYLELESNVASNLSDPSGMYSETSIDNIKSLFGVVNSLVRERKAEKDITVSRGDNLFSILGRMGLNRQQANDVYTKVKKYFDPRDLKAGQKLTVNGIWDTQTDKVVELNSLTLSPKIGERVVISLSKKGEYDVNRERDEIVEEVNSATGEISGTLSQSMNRQGVPAKIINNFIQIFAYSVDFRRDVRKGDRFEIIYENRLLPNGKVVSSGDILYAGLIMRKHRIGLYRFKDSKGNVDYYNEKGLAMKRTLYKMPLNYAARISSPFGKRYHPILKQTRIHWGVDYAAPYGTPILAGGDGVVQVAKYNGAYGNYIKIRHNSEFSTAYGHMKKFANGIRPGVRVKQGQVIAYVGSTGRSTGPHVHYEVIQNGRRVNARTIKASAGENLYGENLKKFKWLVADIQKSYRRMFAQNEQPKMAQK